MRSPIEIRLQSLCDTPELLKGFLCGIEKESLRVDARGGLSQTPHPSPLGSALTHPYITTDFSEALLELITPPLDATAKVMEFLTELHRYVYTRLGTEYLWATSMPCVVSGEESIPVARYGTSNQGTMKHLYRVGLGHRYGRVMQTISGVHFNFSLPDAFWEAHQVREGDGRPRQDFVNDRYFALIRNLQRIGWIVPYLFGASPAVCKSFLGNRPTKLETFDAGTCYAPHATSLRMGDIGYKNNRESEVGVKASYDSLDAYVESLARAITTPYPGYEKIGVKVNGEYRQLNANILQIENEFYTSVRPKQIPQGNEKPTLALKRRGIRYIELRSLDVNAYEPLGISEAQLRFLHVLMLWCLFEDSPTIGSDERREIDANDLSVAHRGREPGLQLRRGGKQVELRQWALDIVKGLEAIGAVLDAGQGAGLYRAALAEQRLAVDDAELTPSARMLREMRDNGESFHQFAKRMSLRHREYFRHQPARPEITSLLDDLAQRSLAEQHALETSDTMSFDDYLARYFAQ